MPGPTTPRTRFGACVWATCKPMEHAMPGNYPPKKSPIFGESHSLSDEEAAYVQEMIQEAQQSSRQLSIPKSDLDAGATTQLAPAAAQIINESKVRPILNRFNRDFLYGQGRFDEYQRSE